MSRIGKIIFSVCVFLFPICTLLTALKPISTHPQHVQPTIIVSKGMSLASLSRELDSNHVIATPFWFSFIGRIMNVSSVLKQGEYALTPTMSIYDLLLKIRSGEQIVHKISIIEGWRWHDLKAVLKATPALKHILSCDNEEQTLAQILKPYTHQEGMFFPSTYYFHYGETDKRILERAHQKLMALLDAFWQSREQGLVIKTPFEALIVASLIEKEASRDEERSKISAVIQNRLKKRMRLQVDPTVIYVLGKQYNGHLSHNDLKVSSPYNTYKHYGLPPTPIALPSQASLYAALHPFPETFLYFVADGSGGHVFSKDLTSHNMAVKRFLRNTK